jgi:hypothetical protein
VIFALLESLTEVLQRLAIYVLLESFQNQGHRNAQIVHQENIPTPKELLIV